MTDIRWDIKYKDLGDLDNEHSMDDDPNDPNERLHYYKTLYANEMVQTLRLDPETREEFLFNIFLDHVQNDTEEELVEKLSQIFEPDDMEEVLNDLYQKRY